MQAQSTTGHNSLVPSVTHSTATHSPKEPVYVYRGIITRTEHPERSDRRSIRICPPRGRLAPIPSPLCLEGNSSA